MEYLIPAFACGSHLPCATNSLTCGFSALVLLNRMYFEAFGRQHQETGSVRGCWPTCCLLAAVLRALFLRSLLFRLARKSMSFLSLAPALKRHVLGEGSCPRELSNALLLHKLLAEPVQTHVSFLGLVATPKRHVLGSSFCLQDLPPCLLGCTRHFLKLCVYKMQVSGGLWEMSSGLF